MALLASGCSAVAQKTAQGNVDEADVTACHALGQTAYHTKAPTQAQTDRLFSDLDKASNSSVRSGAKAAEAAAQSGDKSTFTKDLQAVAQTCHNLGLIDAHGNPT